MNLQLEAFAGISGNMFLALLLDLGAREEVLRQELAKVDFDDYDIRVSHLEKKGIYSCCLDVVCLDQHHDRHHDHDHHHGHRSLKTILDLIDRSDLKDRVKEDAKNLFILLGKSEAKIHHKPLEEVHFHEVGATDSLVDMIGAAILMDDLGLESFFFTKPNVGDGFVPCAHGLYPVPAPATQDILLQAGIPFQKGPVEAELVTPTGACILAYYGRYRPSGSFQGGRVGYGAGSRDLDIPNVLRGVLGTPEGSGTIYQLDCNLDDMMGEDLAYCMDKLFDLGVLDVWFSPIYMKKNRPGHLLSVLVKEDLLEGARDLIWTHTTSLGLRYYPVDRYERERKLETFDSSFGPLGVKVFDGGYSFEYEDLKKIADREGMSLLDLRKRVEREYHG
ncbi:MAG: nickel pincer cofactor biosynthesis protein LarC [Peptoniphilus sp. oral taxon 375]|nr:nickel pincer cofactor biosynthesis protein LarC [Peptoniphilus sp. oral taxon 375]